MSENERVVLSPAEAEAMLPEGEMIHTFRQAGYALIGADWERSKIIEAFQTRKPELSGEQATAMKHGIVFFDDHGAVFVETVANNRLHTDAGDSAPLQALSTPQNYPHPRLQSVKALTVARARGSMMNQSVKIGNIVTLAKNGYTRYNSHYTEY